MATISKTRTVVQWGRPECMATLGILPPYTFEDVNQAYLAKVKDTGPWKLLLTQNMAIQTMAGCDGCY